MRKKVDNFLVKFFVILGIIIFFVALICVANNGFGFNSFLLLVAFLVFLVFFVKKRKEILVFLKEHKKFVVILAIFLVVLGFILRGTFIFIQGDFKINSTLSDTGVHWYGATQLVENGNLGREIGEYEKLYPYLFSYTGTLALFMSVFGNSYGSVLILNIVCDVISCLLLYILFYKWKKRKLVGLLAATAWAINPLQIVFCGLPLAIVIVNMFLIMAITLIYLSINFKNNLIKFLLFSLLAGGVVVTGNAFRPIFVVLLIAYILYWLTVVIKDRTKLKNAMLGCIAMIIGYLTIMGLPGILHQHFNQYFHGEKSHSGWSVFVGANYETKGVWNPDDRDYFFGPILVEQAKGDTDVASSIILKRAFLRYGEMVVSGKIFQHFANKITVLFGDVNNSIYDLPYVFDFSSKNFLYRILQDLILIYYYFVIFIIGWHVVEVIRKKKLNCDDPFRLFLVISLLGLFAASMLVEVMNRYSLPLITILLVFAIDLFVTKRNVKGVL